VHAAQAALVPLQAAVERVTQEGTTFQLTKPHRLFTAQSRRLEPQGARKITQPDSLVDKSAPPTSSDNRTIDGGAAFSVEPSTAHFGQARVLRRKTAERNKPDRNYCVVFSLWERSSQSGTIVGEPSL